MGRSSGRQRTQAGEDAVIRRIAAALESASGTAPTGSTWIGDDAAVVELPAGPLVLSTDAAVAGVHADLAYVSLADLGWKALTATVSDIGAMGARPRFALVTLCVPGDADVDLLAGGLAEASRRWMCPVVGGDVTSADQVMVSVAVAGTVEGSGPAVLRSGASPGDTLLVTGPLGASAAGLRVLRAGGSDEHLVGAHRRPAARVEEGCVARRAGATAMIDVSDGLGIDLHRMAEASGVGVTLEHVPMAAGATEDEALGGGEDYELVIATPQPERLVRAFCEAGLRTPIVIGGCTDDVGERALRGGPLPRAGYEHDVR